jgi:hypothetical protein
MPKGEETHELEEQMYVVLNEALTRAECAARAVARIEFDIVQKHIEQQAQEPPTQAPDGVEPKEEVNVAEQASREFNSTHFQTMFFNLNVIKVAEQLIELLELHELEDDILHTMVHDMFRPRGSSAPPRGGDGEMFIGSDADLLFHKLRTMAEKQQRGRR